MRLLLAIFFQLLFLASAFASFYSVGNVNLKWAKKKITVCWQDTETLNEKDFHSWDYSFLTRDDATTLDPVLKKKVQEIISREFQPELTGIHFVGWKGCLKTPNSDLVIFTAGRSANGDSPYGNANIGRSTTNDQNQFQLLNDKNKTYVYLFLPDIKKYKGKLTEAENLQVIALHEFGHIAGLRHEHARTPNYFAEDSMNDGAKYFSDFDTNSMMNYNFCLTFLRQIGTHFYVISNEQLQKKWLKDYPDRHLVHLEGVAPYLKDTLQFFSQKKIDKYVTEYFVNLGFSSKDLNGLRCLYVYDKKDYASKCEIFQPKKH